MGVFFQICYGFPETGSSWKSRQQNLEKIEKSSWTGKKIWAESFWLVSTARTYSTLMEDKYFKN